MIKLPENKPRELQPTHNIKLFLYGEPYTGKTTFASKFPNPLILSTDGNYKFLTTPALDVNNLTDWKELIDVLAKKDNDYETIIIDVVDHLIDMVRDDILSAYNITHESDLPHGKGWHMVKKPIYTILRKIVALPYNIIFIGHSQHYTETDRIGRDISYINSSLSEKVSNVIKGLVDGTFYVAKETEKEKDEDGNEHIITKYKMYLNTIDDMLKMGSRILFKDNIIDLDYDLFIDLYKDAVINPVKEVVIEKPKKKEIKPLSPMKPKADKPKTEKPKNKADLSQFD